MTYKQNYSCFCCGFSNLSEILNLGKQPLANSYVSDPKLEENTYPLELVFCNNCTHLQLKHTVNPDLLFIDYLYVSGTSNTLKQYFKDFVALTETYVDSPKSVLDIACNDGTQLDMYKEKGYDTYGIDPAKNLYSISSKNHTVVCDYLTTDSLKTFNTKFDIITAQNVFAHNDYPLEFLQICKDYVSDKGKIFIQTSQADMVKNNEFDTIYHEHLSFFSVKSFATLCKRAGLVLLDVVRTPIHGTSFVFVVGISGKDNTQALLEKENTLDLATLIKYSETATKITQDLKTVLEKYKQEGYTLVGYGAAAKGNTLLNFGQITLDYIIDDNPLKQNLYSPGQKIPIVSIEKLHTESKVILVPLAWNFFEEIKSRVIRAIDSSIDIKFIRYFPKIQIV